MVSVVVGVAVAKGLTKSASDAYILVPLACGLASSVMTLTGTIHPPGGATAVLAVSDPTMRALGWDLIPLMAVSCTIMIAVACLMGNMFRRYPVWWWTVGECGSQWTKGRIRNDLEQGNMKDKSFDGEDTSRTASSVDAKSDKLHEAQVLVSAHVVLYPPDLDLSEEELLVLEALAAKLKAREQ
jgi:HPP family protein